MSGLTGTGVRGLDPCGLDAGVVLACGCCAGGFAVVAVLAWAVAGAAGAVVAGAVVDGVVALVVAVGWAG